MRAIHQVAPKTTVFEVESERDFASVSFQKAATDIKIPLKDVVFAQYVNENNVEFSNRSVNEDFSKD